MEQAPAPELGLELGLGPERASATDSAMAMVPDLEMAAAMAMG